MTLLNMYTVRADYGMLCRHVRGAGRIVSPRGRKTYELTGVMMAVHSPDIDPMPVGIGRNLSPAVGAAEALQLIGGVSDPELLYAVAPNFRQFADGSALAGAYGPRLRGQLPEVVDLLRRDPDTRQAVVTIFDPAYDRAGNRDVPCTVQLQFLLRAGRLELHTYMRSNDVWWGWAYDAFQFTQLQLAVAHCLGVYVGTYVHHVGSLHLYDDHAHLVDDIDDPTDELSQAPVLGEGLSRAWESVADLARGALAGTESVPWYTVALAPHLDALGRF